MYDTLKGMILTNQDLIKRLDNVKEVTNRSTGEITEKGYSGNFSFQRNESGYSFLGSLTKAKNNHNFTGITIKEANETINNLSDNIHFDLGNGFLSRVDFGNCFSMKEKPEVYFHSLGYLNAHLDRSKKKKTSLYYGYDNTSRALIFYDKQKEYLDKHVPVPNQFQNGNFLRYELKFKRMEAIKKHFGKDRMKVSDLVNPTLFNYMLDKWKELYLSIQKEPKGIINMSGQNLSLTDLQGLAFQKLIHSYGGLSRFYEWIDLETKRGNIKKGTSKKYLKDKAREVTKTQLRIDNDCLINELDSKVNETAESFKA